MIVQAPGRQLILPARQITRLPPGLHTPKHPNIYPASLTPILHILALHPPVPFPSLKPISFRRPTQHSCQSPQHQQEQTQVITNLQKQPIIPPIPRPSPSLRKENPLIHPRPIIHHQPIQPPTLLFINHPIHVPPYIPPHLQQSMILIPNPTQKPLSNPPTNLHIPQHPPRAPPPLPKPRHRLSPSLRNCPSALNKFSHHPSPKRMTRPRSQDIITQRPSSAVRDPERVTDKWVETIGSGRDGG